jgi:predicted amidohydrolase
MKICVAQIRPSRGNITLNIEKHLQWIDIAAAHEAGIIIFPELSVTGYEPTLAKELATSEDDSRFDIFQKISDTKRITIGIGAPIQTDRGIVIGMVIFGPGEPRQVYSKQYLHEDELPFFVNGINPVLSFETLNKLSLAICYELSVPAHSEQAGKNGAKIYIASVAKTADGVEKARMALSAIAKKYSMTVLMSNCVGHCDNFECGGATTAWNEKGAVIGQLDDSREGVLIIDTDKQELIKKI